MLRYINNKTIQIKYTFEALYDNWMGDGLWFFMLLFIALRWNTARWRVSPAKYLAVFVTFVWFGIALFPFDALKGYLRTTRWMCNNTLNFRNVNYIFANLVISKKPWQRLLIKKLCNQRKTKSCLFLPP